MNPRTRPFPRLCYTCAKPCVDRVSIQYTAKARVGDIIHEFPVPNLQVGKCSNCGELWFDCTSDEQINAALAKYLNEIHGK